MYAFWQYELCDVFIEVSKPWFTAAAPAGSEEAAVQLAARETLWISLDAGLRCEPGTPLKWPQLQLSRAQCSI